MSYLRHIPARDNDNAPQTPPGAIWPAMAGKHKIKTKRPLISILTPVRRSGADWLWECWESLVAQDETNWEWLVELDGAGPIEPIILDLLDNADSRLKVAGCGVQMYAAACRNMALSRAQGSWIFPLDADDKLPLNALSTLLTAATKTNAKAVVGTIEILYPDDTTKQEKHRFPAGHRRLGDTLKLALELQQMPHHAVGTLMETRLVTQLGGYPAVPYAQDLLMQYLVSAQVGIVAVPQVTYTYRQHDRQMTADTISETWRLAQWRSRVALSRMLVAADTTIALPDYPLF